MTMPTQDSPAYPLPGSVLKVLRVEQREDGKNRPVLVYSSELQGKRKKSSKRWRGLDKAVRKMLNAEQTSVSVYRELHERSSRREKDGWLHDLAKNLRKAGRRGKKKL
jgi:hypothetical protein